MKTRPLCLIGQHQYATVIPARPEAIDLEEIAIVAAKTFLIGAGIVHQLFTTLGMWPT